MMITGRIIETTQIASAATAIDTPTAVTTTAASIIFADIGTAGRRGGVRNVPSGNMSIVGGSRFMPMTWPALRDASSPPKPLPLLLATMVFTLLAIASRTVEAVLYAALPAYAFVVRQPEKCVNPVTLGKGSRCG